jgi:hypothetical protein
MLLSSSKKQLRNALIPAVLLLLYDFLSLKNDVNVLSKSDKQKNLENKIIFVAVLKVNDENRNRTESYMIKAFESIC